MPLLTYKEVAAQLRVCVKSVYSLVKRGELPAVRVGDLVRFDPRDVQEFIERGRKAGVK